MVTVKSLQDLKSSPAPTSNGSRAGNRRLEDDALRDSSSKSNRWWNADGLVGTHGEVD